MNTFLIVIFSVALSVAAQFSLKTGMSCERIKEVIEQPFTLHTAMTVLMNKYILSGFILYGLGALVWLRVLSEWDVSKAYPLVGIGFVFTLIVGFMGGENVTILRAIGAVLICTGVILVGRS